MVPDSNWITDFLRRQMEKDTKSKETGKKKRKAKTPPVKVERTYEQDESLNILQELLEEGYDTVELVTPNSACDKCKVQAGEKSLSEAIDNLQHSAPIFEWTHPGCTSCYLLVSSRENDELTPKVVTREGTAEDA